MSAPTLTRLSPTAPGVQDRPFLELSQGLSEVYTRLQPALTGDPSPGDRLAQLGPRPGTLADAARTGLDALVTALQGMQTALRDLQPWLIQADVILAMGGVLAAAVNGAAEAAVGLAALGEALVHPDQGPAERYNMLRAGFPNLRGAYLDLKSKAAILPPPEDIDAALAAIAPLLDPQPTGGARSLRTLQSTLRGAP